MTMQELEIATGIKSWTLRRMAKARGVMWQELEKDLAKVTTKDLPIQGSALPAIVAFKTPLVAPHKVPLRVVLPPGTNRIRLECVMMDGLGGRTFCTVRDNRNFLPGMELEAYARGADDGGGYEYAGVMPRSRGRW